MTEPVKADVDPETLSIIRDMLAEEEAARDPAMPAQKAAVKTPDAPDLEGRRSKLLPGLTPPDEPETHRISLPTLPRWRPGKRQLTGVVLLAFVLLRPALVFVVLCVLLLLALGLALILGPERIWALVLAGVERYRSRHPERATEISARFDRVAAGWNGMLDILSDGRFDALRVPDLRALREADERHDDALAARFDRMRRGA